MPTSIIYKHPSPDCPLCRRKKGHKGSSRSNTEETHTHQCHSVFVAGSNLHNAMWVLRCEEVFKRCPGYRYHKRLLTRFKKALVGTSRKVTMGRVVALPRLVGAMVLPKMKSSGMNRQEPEPLRNLTSESAVSACLDHYGFTQIEKTKKNRKKKMWKIAEDWFVRKS